MNVGILRYRYDYYPYVRNIVGRVPDVKYLRVRDAFSTANILARKVNAFTQKNIFKTFNRNNQFYDANLNKVDLFHFFNGISFGRTPWVSTFETLIPRYDYILHNHRDVAHLREIHKHRLLKASFDVLAGEACRQIIALSETSAHLQRGILDKYPEYAAEIRKKLTVLHPPQVTELVSFEDKGINTDDAIKFMLVGAAFFRKGGIEVLETFSKLRREHGYDIHLTIISSLSADDYIAPRTEDDVRNLHQILDENKAWVVHHASLPNPQVMASMRETHIGLLPTYADSYGYSVLEFQSMGCPVISTDIRALPEINNEQVGWLINVPKDAWGEGIYDSEAARQEMSTQIRAGLERAVHEIFADRDIIRKKTDLAIARIRNEHSPEKHTARLREIYGLV